MGFFPLLFPPRHSPYQTVLIEQLSKTVGGYPIVAQIGKGGMANVFLAIRTGPSNFRKLFALKRLKEELAEPTTVDMFLGEARLTALLSHPNIVQTQGIGFDNGIPFISMEYLEGQSFGKLLKRRTQQGVPLNIQVYIISEILSGLNHAHQRDDLTCRALSVVHQDISPSNIGVTYRGEVKLLDFGIANSTINVPIKENTLKGKLAYMSPEQARGEKVDQRADLFSVGVMLWEAIAQRRIAAKHEKDTVTWFSRANGLWPLLTSLQPHACPMLREYCEKAMALKPRDRYQSAKEFRSDLLKHLDRVRRSAGDCKDQLATLMTEVFSAERKALTICISKKMRAISNGKTIRRRSHPLSVSTKPSVATVGDERRLRLS